MEELKQKTSQQLVDELIQLDRLRLATSRNIGAYQAELQERGLSIMEDRNKQFIRFYGDAGTASISDRRSLEVLNPDRLKLCVTEGVFNKNVTVTTETKYKLDPKFERMLKALFTGDYSFEISLEELIDTQLHITPDAKQQKLLLKKLKGEFEADLKTLRSVFGDDGNWETELWYIHRIKNAELIRIFLPEDMLDATMRELKKCIVVDSKLAIGLDYKKE